MGKGYRWERGHGPQAAAARMKPSAGTLYAIGKVLGVSVGDLLGKTIPDPAQIKTWPPGLLEYVEQEKVPPDEARMLAQIKARGRTPTSADEWKMLQRTIRVVTEGKN